MAAIRDSSGRAWLALACTRDGTIVEVLRDDLRLAKAGARVADIVDPGSAKKAEKLIAALAEQEWLAGWELNVRDGEGARPLYFAGLSSDEKLVLIATPGAPASRENQIYDELSRLNNELINRERELARKSAALERVSAEKSRVIAIAAHDLRNPLTVILSYADLLRLDGAIEGEHREYVDEIAQSARFMMELVEELLDTSRIESGFIDMDLQEIDLVSAARHAATINRMRADRKEISIAFEELAERAVIRADAVKVRQIINNLAVNAIKFSPPRTTVTIRVKRDDARAVVEVQDQGIGIPRANFESIFEPFKTLGPSGTAGEKSTGLGLAIVRKLVELHRGSVQVESEVDRGSLFRVSFPLAS
jgi:two-component system, OmpR family, sensor kinase